MGTAPWAQATAPDHQAGPHPSVGQVQQKAHLCLLSRVLHWETPVHPVGDSPSLALYPLDPLALRGDSHRPPLGTDPCQSFGLQVPGTHSLPQCPRLCSTPSTLCSTPNALCPKSSKWIDPNGIIDAEWVEPVRAVVDDNKMLTFASNEQVMRYNRVYHTKGL